LVVDWCLKHNINTRRVDTSSRSSATALRSEAPLPSLVSCTQQTPFAKLMMKYKPEVFIFQFPIVKTFVVHTIYYQLLSATYARLRLKDEFWTATINAHALQAIIHWCMVFGSHGCNDTHWKRLSLSNTSDLQDDFRKRCLSTLRLTQPQWDGYWKKMTTFRNEYAAHRRIKSSQPVPDLEAALKIAYFYDHWIREVILPDRMDEQPLEKTAQDIEKVLPVRLDHIMTIM